MDEPFALPIAPRDVPELVRYRVRPRPQSKFKTILDAKQLFGDGGAIATVETRTYSPKDGETALELVMRSELPKVAMEDRFRATWGGGIVASHLSRRVGEARKKEIDFAKSPFPLPRSTYPEVLLPFLMRGQPRDGKVRAAYSWTSDRFIARVYYEKRKRETLDLPAGKMEADLVWMYPDLNDWIAMGGVITKLAKPLLPRYDMWFETVPPYRVARFEGPFGPPGAPEIVLELAV
jgi:hypothetical protein